MKFLVPLILVLSILRLNAQNVNLRLQISNQATGIGIKKCLIKVNDQYAITDSLGRATIKLPPYKTVQIKIKQLEYKDYGLKLELLSDSLIDIYLEPNVYDLGEVEVLAEKDNSFGISRLNNVEGTAIFAGKKSESILLQDLNANLAANNSRQIFSKIPGINVFENEGTGTSIGIGGRGLNPNRISNFNTRQNGYDISADALGYPESYYTPPSEALEKIDVLRGASALQYGTQFGGMINYRFKPAERKKVVGNFSQTLGSFGFFNSFNQISGMTKKLSYNTFYNYKSYTGWRTYSELVSHNAYLALTYNINERLKVKGEYTFLTYQAQQPGGLTDQQFSKNAYSVSRERNWFKVNWNLVSFAADYKHSDRTTFNLTGFGLIAQRDALGFLGRPDRSDDTTMNRNLMRDQYRNFGVEARYLQRYHFLDFESHLLLGIRYYQGRTYREQGDADKTNKAVFNFLHPQDLENSNYIFPSLNYAFFAENIFQINSKWSVVPGMRIEYIHTSADGYYRLINKNLAGNVLLDMKVYDQRTRNRSFVLFGLGNQYKLNRSIELYANISQNYRSINFNDMRVTNPNFTVDPELKDEHGFTADGGLRGAIKNLLYFDISCFYIGYNDRIGTTLKVDSATYQIVRYRTNIGSSDNYGLEAFAELDWIKLLKPQSSHKLSTFLNISYIKAYYHSEKAAYDGKRVEYVPLSIVRTGITYAFKNLGFTLQYSYTAKQYSDATNAEVSSTGLYGIIPAYQLLDLSCHYTYKMLRLNTGINNLSNTKYFTRRAEGYPGPGIIPADPMNIYVSLGFRF